MVIPPSGEIARTVSEQIPKDRQELDRLISAGKKLAGRRRELVRVFDELQLLCVNALQAMLAINSMRLALEERWVNRNRQPGKLRLERGKIILQANCDGVSWKEMPSHILKAHPDWFPEYREQRPNLEQCKRLQERLRKMARDSGKQEK